MDVIATVKLPHVAAASRVGPRPEPRVLDTPSARGSGVQSEAMTSGQRAVIVGGGPAGWRCAFSLRERGFQGAIELLCREARPPYDRTMVSKGCLAHTPREEVLSLAPKESYTDAGIRLELGAVATAVDLQMQHVRLADGRAVRYDVLVAATGGRPRVPTSLACPGVHVLRSIEDAERLRRELVTVRHVLIIGGGFIAGEAATALCRRGVAVTMLEALDAPLLRAVGRELGTRIAELHRAAGVDVRVHAAARRLWRSNRGYVVALSDGTELSADAVLVATGMVPATEWLGRTAAISLKDGVVTNSRCQTAVPNVFAAGDCARWWNPRMRSTVRVEHWDTAVRHGDAVAASIMGSNEAFAPIPYVWSMQQGHRLQWVGCDFAWDRVEIDTREQSTVARFLREGELCAGFAIDNPRAIGELRRELAFIAAGDLVAL